MRSTSAVALLSLAVLFQSTLEGAQTPTPADVELARAASVIVTGRVEALDSGRDPVAGYLYTYVTIEVGAVLKGNLEEGRIVIKQLGGRDGDLEMVVADQANFALGEEVLLFLSVRPRDRTLRTVGLWRGKWHILRDAEGSGVAIRTPFGGGIGATSASSFAGEERRLLEPFVAELAAWATVEEGGAPGGPEFVIRPAEAALASPLDTTVGGTEPAATDGEFTLLGPGRWNEADSATAVFVDIQDGGQGGLSGGGIEEIAAARELWNAAGSTLVFAEGNTGAYAGADDTTLCRASYSDVLDGKVTIYFGDPCDEIGNDGTLAIGGFWSTVDGGETVNGTAFKRILEGYVINSDEVGVETWLTTPQCFQDVQTHEIGHALGLGHTSAPGNIMESSLDSDCLSGSSRPDARAVTGQVGPDDIAGVQFIYPADAVPTPPAAPSSLATTSVNSTTILLTWTDNADNEDGFLVGRRSPGGGWRLVGRPGANATSFSDAGLEEGSLYCYTVLASNEVGRSAAAKRSCATAGGG